MKLGLDGRRVLVTGSTRGIGAAVAEVLLEEGARVMVSGREQETVRGRVADLAGRFGSDRVTGMAGDFLRPEVLADAAHHLEEVWGGLDHLVCNIGSGRSVPPLDEDEEEWRRVVDVNLTGATRAVRALLPTLEASGGKAAICFVGSICGMDALGCPSAYAAAKAGLEAYARTIARPLGRRGIRANVVSPGNVVFPGSTWESKLEADRTGVEAMLEREVPLGRLGRPREIGEVVAFLLSDRAAFVTGANWVVDGGQRRGR